MTDPRQLAPPSIVNTDPSARELLRVWVTQEGQHMAIAGETWGDPAAWGLLLVDLAKHVANMYEQTSGRPKSVVLERIHEGFKAEWSAATDAPTGGLVD